MEAEESAVGLKIEGRGAPGVYVGELLLLTVENGEACGEVIQLSIQKRDKLWGIDEEVNVVDFSVFVCIILVVSCHVFAAVPAH
jgi:hypothetical protein